MKAMSNLNTSNDTGKLDSELLRTFLAVADSGSFSRGASRIFRSQSAVSLQVKQLENILGQPVFQRHARGVLLTSAGEKLRPAAQKVVTLLDETISELKVNPLEGAIRIGIPDEYGESVLPAVIAQFARNHPQVELSVRCSFSTEFHEALTRDEIDLAVYAVESPDESMLLLRKEKTHWVTSRYHSIHEQNPVPVALFDRACWWRDSALEALDKVGKPYRVVFNSESVMGISAAISAGVAVGLVGESSMCDDFRILTSKDGFPKLPDSALVLECRKGPKDKVALALSQVIETAFGGT